MNAVAECPPDHAHGRTETCYRWHKCRCAACGARQARSRSQRGRSLVAAAPAIAHLRQLRAAGATRAQIAAAASADPRALSALLARPPARMHRRLSAALLAVTVADALAAPAAGRHPARGARRRIQALYALGWSLESQSAMAGLEVAELRRTLAGRRFVPARVDVAVRQLHRGLWQTPPPTRTDRELRAVRARRQRAARLGYAPTLAWDDIDRDAELPEPPGGDVDDVDDIALELALAGEPVRLLPRERATLRRLRGGRRIVPPQARRVA